MIQNQGIPTLIELDGASGELKPSETFPGYIEFIPSSEELKRMEMYLSDELTRTLEDYKPIFEEARENTETYKAKKMKVDGMEDILPSPLARIAADQNIALGHSTILRPSSLLSIKPYFPASYDVMIGVPVPGPDGQMAQAAMPMPRDAEKIAKTWELAYEFILRERVKLPKKLQQILTDTITGAAPCWVKVCYHSETRPVMGPTSNGLTIDLSDKRETEMPAGDPVKWVVLPVYNVIRPVDEDDVQASPWIAESTPMTPDDFLLKWYSGEYPLITDEEEAKKMSRMTSDVKNEAKESSDETNKKATVQLPRQKCEIFDVWVYWDVKIPNPNDPKKKLLKRLSLLVPYHYGARKALACFRNPYDHQFRPLVPFFQIEDPHTLSGSSTVATVKWHQRMKTTLLNLEVQGAANHANDCYFVDPDTEVFSYLAGRKKLQPNEIIPKREDEYAEPFTKGSNHFSLLGHAQYVDNDGMRAVNMSSIELGADVPNRTPSGTVSQVIQQGNLQNLMFLRTICERLVEVIKLDLRTRRQFYPTGETLHVYDRETQQILEVLFQFPVEDAIDNFRFAMTAADEEMAKEHELPQLMGLLNANQQRSNFIAQVTAPMSNPMLLPGQVQLLSDIAGSDQEIWDRVVALMRTDLKKFDYTNDIKAIIDERNAFIAQQQQAAQAQKQGVANGPTGPQGGQPNPGGPGVQGGGSSGTPQQPGVSGPPQQAPAGVSEAPPMAM